MLDFAKAVHEAIGIESPRLFIGGFALLGLILFGGLGWIIDHGYRVKMREQTIHAAPHVSEVPEDAPKGLPSQAPSQINTTSGPLSPIIPNNSGSVTITNEEVHPKDPK